MKSSSAIDIGKESDGASVGACLVRIVSVRIIGVGIDVDVADDTEEADKGGNDSEKGGIDASRDSDGIMDASAAISTQDGVCDACATMAARESATIASAASAIVASMVRIDVNG